jgi:hypothetical protein
MFNELIANLLVGMFNAFYILITQMLFIFFNLHINLITFAKDFYKVKS